MLRATPELAKLTTTRTGPPRSPQPLAACATCVRALTRSARAGLEPFDAAAREVARPLLRDQLAPVSALASGRSVTETVGMLTPGELPLLGAATALGSHAVGAGGEATAATASGASFGLVACDAMRP